MKVHTVNPGFFKESRLFVGDFNEQNDRNPQTGKAGIRYHNKITGLFLYIIGKAIFLRDDTQNYYFVNKRSFEKWRQRHRVVPEHEPFQKSIEEIVKRFRISEAIETPPSQKTAKKKKTRPETPLITEIKQAKKRMKQRTGTLPLYLYNRAFCIHKAQGTTTVSYQNATLLTDALLKRDTKQASTILSHPHFFGINAPIFVSLSSGAYCGYAPVETALTLSIKEGCWDIFCLLLKHPNIDLDNNPYLCGTALHTAARLGKSGEKYLHSLLNKRASPILLDQRGLSPLLYAQKVSLQTYNRLVNAFSVNSTDDEGWTDAHYAVAEAMSTENLEPIKAILHTNISLNGSDKQVKTLLSLALELSHKNAAGNFFSKKQKEIIFLLINNGAKLSPNSFSNFFFELPKPVGWEEIARKLIEAGANPMIPDEAGNIPCYGLRSYPSTHPVKQLVAQKYGLAYEEMRLYTNVLTLFGKRATRNLNGTLIYLKGGNYSLPVYRLLEAAWKAFSKQAPSSLGNTVKKRLAQTTEFAKEMLQGTKWKEYTERVKQVNFPVIIPSGWEKHSTAVIIYGNILIKANCGERSKSEPSGLSVHTFNRQNLKTIDLESLLANSLADREVYTQDFFEYYINEVLKLKPQKTIEIPEQNKSNCTWVSSARPALQTALALVTQFPSPPLETDAANKAAQAFTLEGSAKEAMEEFPSFCRFFALSSYLRYLDQNLEKLPSLPNIALFSELAYDALMRLKENPKDTYSRAILDALLQSGHNLAGFYHKAQNDEALLNTLYEIPKNQSLREAISP